MATKKSYCNKANQGYENLCKRLKKMASAAEIEIMYTSSYKIPSDDKVRS